MAVGDVQYWTNVYFNGSLVSNVYFKNTFCQWCDFKGSNSYIHKRRLDADASTTHIAWENVFAGGNTTSNYRNLSYGLVVFGHGISSVEYNSGNFWLNADWNPGPTVGPNWVTPTCGTGWVTYQPEGGSYETVLTLIGSVPFKDGILTNGWSWLSDYREWGNEYNEEEDYWYFHRYPFWFLGESGPSSSVSYGTEPSAAIITSAVGTYVSSITYTIHWNDGTSSQRTVNLPTITGWSAAGGGGTSSNYTQTFNDIGTKWTQLW